MGRPDAWFRMYNAVVDNPKVQSLKDALFRAWVNLLCVASQNGGKLPPTEDVAFKLRTTSAKAATLVDTLEQRGLFDRDAEGNLVPHDWNDLQFKSDTSTDRVKRFRERERNVSETPDETDHSRAEQNISEPPKAPEGPGYTQEFLKFWEAYPKKSAKDHAWSAWKKRKDRPEISAVLTALDLYIRTKPTDCPWKNPATWINGGCWNDVPAGSTVVPITGAVNNTEAQWEPRIKGWNERKFWIEHLWGPPPDHPDCKAPKGLLPPKTRPSEDYLRA